MDIETKKKKGNRIKQIKQNIRSKSYATNSERIRTEPSESEEKFSNLEYEFKKGKNRRLYIMNLFPLRLYAELYFAWCKDCSEKVSVENAKYFRDELLLRKNKDLNSFNHQKDYLSLGSVKSYLIKLMACLLNLLASLGKDKYLFQFIIF